MLCARPGEARPFLDTTDGGHEGACPWQVWKVRMAGLAVQHMERKTLPRGLMATKVRVHLALSDKASRVRAHRPLCPPPRTALPCCLSNVVF